MTIAAEKDHALKQLRACKEVSHFLWWFKYKFKILQLNRHLVFVGSAEGIKADGGAEAEV